MKLYVSHASEEIRRESRFLDAYIKAAEKTLKESPPGNLKIHRRKGSAFFSLSERSVDGTGLRERYLGKKDPLLPVYYQKYCARQILRLASSQKKILETDPLRYDWNIFQKLLRELEADGKGITNAVKFHSNEYLLQEWQNKAFDANPYHPQGEKLFKTVRGEMTRSKNECIAANIMHGLGISYKYEKPVVLRSGKIIYPDFNMLSHVNGGEFWLEIFGMMDKPDYAEKNFRRIDELAECGIILNDNLIVMFEYEGIPFNTALLEEMIRRTVLNPDRR